MRILIWLFAAIYCISAATTKEFINFGLFICPREEKGLSRCLKDILNTFLPYLATGVPSVGVPKCEPLAIPSMSLQQTVGPISVISAYTDTTVRGSSAMHVDEFNFLRQSRMIYARISIPQVRMKGYYKMLGHISRMPIHGEGKFSVVYDDINADIIIKLGEIQGNNSKDQIICQDLDIKFDAEHASIEFENLYNAEGKDITTDVSLNWSKLAEDMKSPMVEKLSEYLKPIIEYALANIKPDELFKT